MTTDTPISGPPLTTTGPTTTIRDAGPDDAPIVHQMVLEIAGHENSLQAVETDPSRWRQLLGRSDVHVLLASVDGRPAGYVSATRHLQLWLGRDILALDDLYVRRGFRDHGVGQQLMNALATVADQDELLIRWEMREDNQAAQRFYRRLGADLVTKVIATWPSTARGHSKESHR